MQLCNLLLQGVLIGERVRSALLQDVVDVYVIQVPITISTTKDNHLILKYNGRMTKSCTWYIISLYHFLLLLLLFVLLLPFTLCNATDLSA